MEICDGDTKEVQRLKLKVNPVDLSNRAALRQEFINVKARMVNDFKKCEF